MRKALMLMLAVVMALAVVAALAQEEKAKVTNARDPEKEFLAAVKRGKALFNDAKLGTASMSCNTCHKDGGTVDVMMGEMKLKAFDQLGTRYPKYVYSMGGQVDQVITLDQIVNYCIIGPMKGKALAWDDQRLADIVAYCTWVKPAIIPDYQPKE